VMNVTLRTVSDTHGGFRQQRIGATQRSLVEARYRDALHSGRS